ncbi:MAG: MFS transporter, partial [Variovorax sp.]|nr:MFS transporter [Variovorax sp.]
MASNTSGTFNAAHKLGDGLAQPARNRAMMVIILGIAVAVLDGTIVNLALPGI